MPGNNLSFKDKLQSRVATYLRCAGDVNNQIKKDLLLRLSVNFYLWNRWIFGKVTSKKCQGSGFLVRFVWLARTLLLHKSWTTRFHNHRRLRLPSQHLYHTVSSFLAVTSSNESRCILSDVQVPRPRLLLSFARLYRVRQEGSCCAAVDISKARQ